MNHVVQRLIEAARKLLAEDLTLWETEPPEDFLSEFVAKRTEKNPEFPRLVAEAATRMAKKKRTVRKPCPGCGRRVPAERQQPPFEGHKKDCTLVQKWNDKLPPKNVEGALTTRTDLIRYSKKAEQEKMDFVIDALGSWSDAEIDQHLQGLKSRLQDEPHTGENFDVETELRCWSKALAELAKFGDET